MRILIAGKRASLRRALKTLFQTRPGLETVALVKDKEELLHMFETTSPDFLLLDEDLDNKIVDTALIPLLERDPNIMILVLGQRSERRDDYLAAGAFAYVTKVDSPQSLLTAIEEARLQVDRAQGTYRGHRLRYKRND